MSPVQQKRLILVSSLVIGLGLALVLILYALSQNINVFYSPTQLAEQPMQSNKPIRVGGMVVKESVVRKEGLAVEFVITDFHKTIKVEYEGILPDLFREGQGIVALGQLENAQVFKATQILAKHDEKYMPPEVADALKTAEKANQNDVGADLVIRPLKKDQLA